MLEGVPRDSDVIVDWRMRRCVVAAILIQKGA